MINKSELSEWARKLDKSEGELDAELEVLLKCDVLQGISDARQREVEALRILKNRYARQLLASGTEVVCNVLVLGQSGTRTVEVTTDGQPEKVNVMNVATIIKKPEGGYEYIQMSIWRDNIDYVPQLEPYAVYEVNLTERSGQYGKRLLVTNTTKWKKEKTLEKDQVLSMVRKLVEGISYHEYSRAAGNKKPYIIEGSVIRHFTGMGKNGPYAGYGIRPSDMEDIEDLIETQGITAWISPDMLKWGDDSYLVMIGTLRAGRDGATVLQADVIIPTITFPLNIPETSTPELPDTTAPTPIVAPANPGTPAKPKNNGEMFDNVQIVKGGDPFEF